CKTQSKAQVNNQYQGTITISGAFALYPMMQRWAEEFHSLHPGVEFDISAGGAGKGMTDVLSNAVDIGMISRDIVTDEIAKGAYGVAVTKDAVFSTVNVENPVLQDLLTQGIQPETFIKIYITGEITTWGQVVGRPEISDEIHIYTRSDSCGAGEIWAKFLGNKKQEDLLGIGVSGDPGVVGAVAKDPLGIGYNNLNYAFDITTGKPVAGITVVPIDINLNGQADQDEIINTNAEAISAVASGNYPSPPARLLYLATNGKPSGLTQIFIEWILTDGQDFVSESGYILLTQEQLEASLNRIR
ncbi:MAG: substrate-binding domain-containing protein, partial [Anaerolineales bacterium]